MASSSSSTVEDLEGIGFSSPVPALHRNFVDGETDQGFLPENADADSIRAVHRMCQQISPGIFYGSPLGAPARDPHKLMQLLQDTDVKAVAHRELTPRKQIWATFPRQQDAMLFALNLPHAFLFSYQDHWTGQRRFLVSSHEEFWCRYKCMNSKFRHHYEVIQEGFPCHLYFDLEYNIKANRGKNGDQMVDLLISYVFRAILDTYQIPCVHDWIIELDSSTEEKFSRHLVIRLPHTAFQDNSQIGGFVEELCSLIVRYRDDDPRLNELFVRKDLDCDQSSQQLFVDKAVYSRNRCFRLPFSSKAGKRSILLPTQRYKCKSLGDESIFMESLICRMDFNCQKLLTFCRTAIGKPEELVYLSRELGGGSCLSTQNRYLSGKSPFPQIDEFIESTISSGTAKGRIRSWYWFADYDLIIYNIAGNRYCERIGRQHKSNNVLYVVDLRLCCYYQKCYDPDCRGFRSQEQLIPSELIPKHPLGTSHGDSLLEAANIDFNLQLNEKDDAPYSYVSVSNSRTRSWWQKVVRNVSEIESSKKTLDFDEQLGDALDDR